MRIRFSLNLDAFVSHSFSRWRGNVFNALAVQSITNYLVVASAPKTKNGISPPKSVFLVAESMKYIETMNAYANNIIILFKEFADSAQKAAFMHNQYNNASASMVIFINQVNVFPSVHQINNMIPFIKNVSQNASNSHKFGKMEYVGVQKGSLEIQKIIYVIHNVVHFK